MNQQAIDRLQLKNPAEAIIERVQLKNDTGQLTYLAVSVDSPAGRKLGECQRVAIKLSLHTPNDLVPSSVVWPPCDRLALCG